MILLTKRKKRKAGGSVGGNEVRVIRLIPNQYAFSFLFVCLLKQRRGNDVYAGVFIKVANAVVVRKIYCTRVLSTAPSVHVSRPVISDRYSSLLTKMRAKQSG